MKELITQDKVNQYKQLGFDENLIRMAWQEAATEAQLLDTMLTIGTKNNELQSAAQGKPQQDDDYIMNQVIMDSIEQNRGSQVSFEVMNPEQRKRQDCTPCGLKNVGNTCYFNSLLQTYFFNNEFVKRVLKFIPPGDVDASNKRLKTSIDLVLNLQSLFVSLIGSDKKYVDPTNVVKSICDDFGNHLPIGDQKDVGEFNHFFLSRIEEGLQTNQNKNHSRILSDSFIENNPQPSDSNSQLLRQHSSIVTEESLVSHLFFGKAIHTFTFKQNNVEVVRESEDLFNFIPLDVRLRNLYDSWDSFIINEIDDYKNDNEESVKAIKYNWIKTPPETLSFQIQRVQYDVERKDSVKLNDEFKFDMEIYADRFLHKNNKQYLQIREKNQQLKQQQKEIENNLKALNSYQNKFDLHASLGGIVEFLQLQTSNQSTNPAHFGKFSASDIKTTLNTLINYQTQVQKRKEALLKQYEELEKKIQDAFNNMKSQKYILQSILIHEGLASSGHYYAYINDARLKQWYKFNDIHVIKEEQDKVLLDAKGGNGNLSAYLLVYIREDIFNKDIQYFIPARKYRTSSAGNEYLSDVYGQYLGQQQRESIIKENDLFRQEIEDYKMVRVIENIMEIYSRKFEFINEQSRTIMQKHNAVQFKPPYTLNFVIFVKTQPDQVRFGNIVKWLIMDSSTKEAHPDKLGVLDGKAGDRFITKLLDKFKTLYSEFKAPRLVINPTERTDLQKLQAEYLTAINIGANCLHFLQKFVTEDYKQALQTLNMLCKATTYLDGNNYFQKLIINMKKLVPITILFSMIKPGSTLDEQLLKLLGAFLSMKYYSMKDPKVWNVQISILLNEINVIHPAVDLTQIINNYDVEAKIQADIELLEQQPQELQEFRELIQQQHDITTWSTQQTQDVLFEGIMSNFEMLKSKYKAYTLIVKELDNAVIPLMPEDWKKFF